MSTWQPIIAIVLSHLAESQPVRERISKMREPCGKPLKIIMFCDIISAALEQIAPAPCVAHGNCGIGSRRLIVVG